MNAISPLELYLVASAQRRPKVLSIQTPLAVSRSTRAAPVVDGIIAVQCPVRAHGRRPRVPLQAVATAPGSR